VARLATQRGDGRVDLVPFVFAWMPAPEPGLGWLVSAVDAKPKRSLRLQRLANVAATPGVTVLVDHYDEDWTALWWVRIRGAARVLDPGPTATDALGALAAKYPQYRRQPPPGPVMSVSIEAVSGWSAT
jgi:PPOX class probable F420-dependent enzyme